MPYAKKSSAQTKTENHTRYAAGAGADHLGKINATTPATLAYGQFSVLVGCKGAYPGCSSTDKRSCSALL